MAEPDRLVRILNIGYIGEMLELRARTRTLDIAAYLPPRDRTLTGLDEPLRLSVVAVTGDLPTLLGRTPCAAGDSSPMTSVPARSRPRF